MDLGITGRTALVCASSQGLGRGCAEALAAAGARVIVNGRDADKLARATASLEAAGEVDILVNKNGGPPPADFRDLDHAKLLAGVEANMLTPIAMVQAVIDGMIKR